MTTMTYAVAKAQLNREDFSDKKVGVPANGRVYWPRKRNNRAVGIVRDIRTGEAVGKL